MGRISLVVASSPQADALTRRCVGEDHVTQDTFQENDRSASSGGPDLAEIGPDLVEIGPILVLSGPILADADRCWATFGRNQARVGRFRANIG